MNGITVLIKGTLQNSLNTAAVRRHRDKAICEPGREPPLETESASALISDIPAFRTVRNKLLLFISYRYIVFYYSRLNGVRQLLWSESAPDQNTFHQTSTKANGVLPKERTGHSKHPLPTTQEKTLHMEITRWSTPKSDWLCFFAAKDGEALYSQQKQDQELTVVQIVKSLLSN